MPERFLNRLGEAPPTKDWSILTELGRGIRETFRGQPGSGLRFGNIIGEDLVSGKFRPWAPFSDPLPAYGDREAMLARGNQLAGMAITGGMPFAPRGALGMAGGKVSLSDVIKEIEAAGYQVNKGEGGGPGIINAYTGSSYVDAMKVDPITGLRQMVRVRVADHPPGKNFQIGRDYNVDVRDQDVVDRLRNYLSKATEGLDSAVALRQRADQLFDRIGYTASGHERAQIVDDIYRRLREGRPTRQMRRVMSE